MAYKLSQHDKKVLLFGLLAAAVLFAYAYIVSPLIQDWRATKAQIAANRKIVDSLAGNVGRRINQASIMPVLEMPVTTEKQQHLFKTSFNKQLTDAGIQAKSLQYVTTGKTPNNLGFTVSKLKCDAKCNMQQVVRLLGSLPENPYLLGIEELRISCDPKKREEITLSITVSTFCRN